MRQTTRLLPLALPTDVYGRLAREARANERDPIQHARFILKRAPGVQHPTGGSETAEAGNDVRAH